MRILPRRERSVGSASWRTAETRATLKKKPLPKAAAALDNYRRRRGFRPRSARLKAAAITCMGSPMGIDKQRIEAVRVRATGRTYLGGEWPAICRLPPTPEAFACKRLGRTRCIGQAWRLYCRQYPAKSMTPCQLGRHEKLRVRGSTGERRPSRPCQACPSMQSEGASAKETCEKPLRSFAFRKHS